MGRRPAIESALLGGGVKRSVIRQLSPRLRRVASGSFRRKRQRATPRPSRGGQADGRWACLDEDSGDELTWVIFDRGRVVEGTADVYAGESIVLSSDAEGELAPEGIFCEPKTSQVNLKARPLLKSCA